MTETALEDRCRLIIVVPPMEAPLDADLLSRALDGGDVATLIIPQYGLDDASFSKILEQWVPVAQGKDVAVLGAAERRLLMRHGVDGAHLVAGASEVKSIVESQMDNMIIGASCGPTRHAALELGEARPDYVFLGKFGGDTHDEVHPKYLELARWWSQVIEIPAVLLAGKQVESVAMAAATGVEFVALSSAIFGGQAIDPANAVRHANAILEKYPLANED